jgi:hypothetical protein
MYIGIHLLYLCLNFPYVSAQGNTFLLKSRTSSFSSDENRFYIGILTCPFAKYIIITPFLDTLFLNGYLFHRSIWECMCIINLRVQANLLAGKRRKGNKH